MSAFEPHYEGSSIVWGPAGGACSAVGSHQRIARAGHHLTPCRLPSGRDVFQELGEGFTLIDLDGAGASAQRLRDAAERLHVPLRVVTAPDPATKNFYGQPLILVRPDQFVAWAGSDIDDAGALLRRVVGGLRGTTGTHITDANQASVYHPATPSRAERLRSGARGATRLACAVQ